MRNKSIWILFLAGSLSLASCCADKQCEAFPEQHKADWLPYSKAKVLVFKSQSGDEIKFEVTETKASEAYTVEGGKWNLSCGREQCLIDGTFRSKATGGLPGANSSYDFYIDSEFQRKIEQRTELRYTFGDISGTIKLHPYLQMYGSSRTDQFEPDSIVNNISIGDKTYEEVLIQTRNMSNPDNDIYHIQKVYLSRGYGVVAFVSRGTLYQLEL